MNVPLESFSLVQEAPIPSPRRTTTQKSNRIVLCRAPRLGAKSLMRVDAATLWYWRNQTAQLSQTKEYDLARRSRRGST
jgi:hypothetical protein